MSLILDKIRLPSNATSMPRPRLIDALDESMSGCTATIIHSRANTGKTVLAAEFAAHCKRRIAWYKVDASDTDRRVFLEYLVASVRGQRTNFATDAVMKFAESTMYEEVPVVVEAFLFELLESGTEPLLIVIDDLHLINDADWIVPFFRRLLPLLPTEAHMIITTRTLPPAPLWRMRSKQTLSVIDETMLAFTKDEAKRLFQRYGLSEGQACTAYELTRGRAGALDTMGKLVGVTSDKARPQGNGLFDQLQILRQARTIPSCS